MDVVFLLVGLLTAVNGNHLYDEITSEYDEIVKLERHNGDGRLRRQGLDFPDTLEYSFNLKQSKKSLRLKRNTYVRDYVPLTMHRKGLNKLLTGYEEEFSKSAFYLDDKTGAAVFLHCEDFNEDCSMYGTFHDKGEHYVVHPAENGFHRIKRTPRDNVDMSYDFKGEIDKNRIKNALALKNMVGKGVIEEHTIEISFFLDDSVYSFFLDKYKGNPTLAMKWLLRYYVQVANAMHLRYRTVQETYPFFKINILLNEVVVMKELSDCPWIEDNLYSANEVVSSDALDSFASWQYENKDNYIQYDHALAITRRDLVVDTGSGAQPGIVGQTYFDGVCVNPLEAVSIQIDNYLGTLPDVCAHEVGHNIGAYHDGTVGCDDRNMRLMSSFVYDPRPRTTFNTWFFSDCSVKQFHYFFERVVGKPSCTMDTLGGGAALEEQIKVPPGGETYTHDEQCQFTFGSDSYFVGPVKKSMCKFGMDCYDPVSNNTLSIYTFLHTKCGKRSWCDRGRCIPRIPPR